MKQIILVYQMGKVGSLAVTDSIAAAGFEHVTISADLADNGHYVIDTHSHNRAADLISRYPDDKIIVLTMVREILRRDISAFFQAVTNIVNGHWYVGTKEFVESASSEELISLFRRRHKPYYFGAVEQWFRRFEKVQKFDLLPLLSQKRKGDCGSMRVASRLASCGSKILTTVGSGLPRN